jgi:hypothetical protein
MKLVIWMRGATRARNYVEFVVRFVTKHGPDYNGVWYVVETSNGTQRFRAEDVMAVLEFGA